MCGTRVGAFLPLNNFQRPAVLNPAVLYSFDGQMVAYGDNTIIARPLGGERFPSFPAPRLLERRVVAFQTSQSQRLITRLRTRLTVFLYFSISLATSA